MRYKQRDIISKRLKNSCDKLFNQVFRDGYFHADMHPGNILITADGTLVPMTLALGQLDFSDRLFLARLLMAILERDYDYVARLHHMLACCLKMCQLFIKPASIVEPVLGKALEIFHSALF